MTFQTLSKELRKNNFRFSRENRRTKVLPQYMEAPSGLSRL